MFGLCPNAQARACGTAGLDFGLLVAPIPTGFRTDFQLFLPKATVLPVLKDFEAQTTFTHAVPAQRASIGVECGMAPAVRTHATGIPSACAYFAESNPPALFFS